LVEKKTQVKNMTVKSRAARLLESAMNENRVEELKPRKPWLQNLFQLDQLGRNLVVTGCLFLVVVAVRNAGTPESMSVFNALRTSAGMEWDESVGKLSFVNSVLPPSVQAVWNSEPDIAVFSPMKGEVVHAWSRQEPFVMIESKVRDVRAAADGEVMSIAHGLDEEKIVRIRHDDESESIYGNLGQCYLQAGDRVYAGDVFAALLADKPLAFELRVGGRSIDPVNRWQQMQE